MSVKLMAIVWELELPPGEKLVLLALADQANDSGKQCWPSVETIAHRSGQGERTVRRALASLEEKGHLTRNHRDGTSNQYHVHPCQIGTPAKLAPLPKTTKTPAKLAPKPSRTIIGLSDDKPNRARARKPAVEKPDSVSRQVWDDFQQHRKAKRAPLTITALEGILREADKARWTLEDALRECMARGWQSFKAEWVNDNGRTSPNNSSRGGSTASAVELARQRMGLA